MFIKPFIIRAAVSLDSRHRPDSGVLLLGILIFVIAVWALIQGFHRTDSGGSPIGVALICFGLLFLGLAAIPFDSIVRIVLAVMGGVIFLVGVAGWVLLEDVRMFPTDAGGNGEAPH